MSLRRGPRLSSRACSESGAFPPKPGRAAAIGGSPFRKRPGSGRFRDGRFRFRGAPVFDFGISVMVVQVCRASWTIRKQTECRVRRVPPIQATKRRSESREPDTRPHDDRGGPFDDPRARSPLQALVLRLDRLRTPLGTGPDSGAARISPRPRRGATGEPSVRAFSKQPVPPPAPPGGPDRGSCVARGPPGVPFGVRVLGGEAIGARIFTAILRPRAGAGRSRPGPSPPDGLDQDRVGRPRPRRRARAAGGLAGLLVTRRRFRGAGP